MVFIEQNTMEKVTYPYSMGTTPLMETLEKIFTETTNNYDTWVINILAIIRNNYEKDITVKELYRKVEEELNDIIRDSCELMSKCVNIKKPILIFYAHTLKISVPFNSVRPEIHKRVIMGVVNKLFYDKFKKNKPVFIQSVFVQKIALDNFKWPHYSIREIIKKQDNTRTCLYTTHVTFDYHVMQWFPTLRLLESYTGNLIGLQDLPQKVFKLDIPFNEYTHAILGDKDYVKPYIKINEKKRLIQLAEDEKWIFKSKEYIKSSLIKNNFNIPFNLVKPRG